MIFSSVIPELLNDISWEFFPAGNFCYLLFEFLTHQIRSNKITSSYILLLNILEILAQDRGVMKAFRVLEELKNLKHSVIIFQGSNPEGLSRVGESTHYFGCNCNGKFDTHGIVTRQREIERIKSEKQSIYCF